MKLLLSGQSDDCFNLIEGPGAPDWGYEPIRLRLTTPEGHAVEVWMDHGDGWEAHVKASDKFEVERVTKERA